MASGSICCITLYRSAPSTFDTKCVVISGVAGVYAMFQDPHDIAGAFSDAQMAANPPLKDSVPPGEWHAYGRTLAGDRYSQLLGSTLPLLGSQQV